MRGRRILERLNELNFQRFDAKLEQRLAQQDARWEGRLVALEATVEKRAAELRASMADHRAELHRSLSRYWAGTVIPLAGLIIALYALG